MSSQLPGEGSSPDDSQSIPNVNDFDDTLPWEPKTMFAKASTTRYWVVENTKQCSQFCKDQLKVQTAKYTTNSRAIRMVLRGRLKLKNLLILGTSTSRRSIANMAQHISYANIVTLFSHIQILIRIKALRQLGSI
jgi:hypothetical protein